MPFSSAASHHDDLVLLNIDESNMPGLGPSRRFDPPPVTSVLLPPQADNSRAGWHVSNVPGADIGLRDSFEKRVPQDTLRVRRIFG